MIARLALKPVDQADVEIAWATYRALVLAEADDPSLLADTAHQEALDAAYERYSAKFDQWSRQ